MVPFFVFIFVRRRFTRMRDALMRLLEPPIEALEGSPSFLIGELAAKHLQEVARGGEGLEIGRASCRERV